MSIVDIKPYIETELDCFQNLQISVLQYFDLETKYLGALWPWEFKFKYKNEHFIEIENTDSIDNNKMKSVYNAKLITEDISVFKEKKHKITSYLNDNIPVFLGMDQFHVPYHLPTLYQKKHGLHTTLLTANNDINEFQCISAIPLYKGSISLGAIEHGSLNKWFATLSLSDSRNPNSAFIKGKFISILNIIKSKYDTDTSNINQHAYTLDIIYILEKMCESSSVDFAKKIEFLSSGTWGWKIGSKAKLLIEYLKMPELLSRGGNIVHCIDIITLINNEWIVAFRLLFKAIYSNTKMLVQKVISKLKDIVELEKCLLNLLISTI